MTTIAIGMPQGWEWLILLALGLLIFGKRLPEVGRSIGKAIVEFKKGVKNIDDEINSESNKPTAAAPTRHLEAESRSVPQGPIGGPVAQTTPAERTAP